MISVIIPVYNEHENIESLLDEIALTAEKTPITEIIYIDDGSTDKTYTTLAGLKAKHPKLRVLRHSVRSGQSAGLWTGAAGAKNDILVTLDGDGQNNPADIEKVYHMFKQSGGLQEAIMVAGQREKRNDNFVRRISSRTANKIRSWLLQDKTRDTGCSLKMFRRIDYLTLPYFNHMHRYLPALMMRDGVKVTHVNVSHRARTKGSSKYGTFDRLAVGIYDLFGVLWLMKRARPKIVVTEE
jgi:dolichol-phosphate mannosyltransferase